jgi:hypothetical protein
MAERKTGEVIESLADFWLGMAGAAAKGLSELTETRRKRKADNQKADLFGEAAVAVKTAIKEALEVADQVTKELPLAQVHEDAGNGDGHHKRATTIQAHAKGAPPAVTMGGKVHTPRRMS